MKNKKNKKNRNNTEPAKQVNTVSPGEPEVRNLPQNQTD
ncbi:hypothetical protein FTV88_2432 [Heliorestis convoluta]|uniref:Uncharacterized protein n=1 Tax=Heliorestis convoluta TaxID=356322 RepID=A0A5Q2N8F0_9FIRM|nr:hypothetical protein FTV88_2432 [Heliorestis convoluta]